jgi:hypothetical protein
MAEPLRKDEQLTTADLAGRSEQNRNVVRPVDDPARPKPVRSETEETRDRGADLAATPLFSDSDRTELRTRWSNVQTGFVDEPRKAVEEADNLVASVMKRLAEGFATERTNLEKQWDSGDNVSTEDLRVALQRYRSFFDRLLNA